MPDFPDCWFEDHEDPCVFYGPREEPETAEEAFKNLVAEQGDVASLRGAEKVWMQYISGEKALEFFDGEYEEGWIVCGEAPAALPAWKIEVEL